MPVLPPDIPKGATIWLQLSDKTPCGQDAVWTTPDGSVNEFYQFNDRGRGPKTYSTYRLDSRGLVTFEETKGVDYINNPVNETFSIKDGVAAWKNRAEDDHQDKATGRYFVDLDGGPTSFFLLVSALLTKGNKLALLDPTMANWEATYTDRPGNSTCRSRFTVRLSPNLFPSLLTKSAR